MRARPGSAGPGGRLVAAALLLTLLPAAPAAAAPATLHWGQCPPAPPGVARDPRQECVALEVPLHHRAPDGRKLTVTVSRIAAADPALRRGVLLVNPGGPGAPGLDLPSALLPLLPRAVADRYDVVGFDPRGAGTSSPITCGIPATTPPDLVVPYPAADGSIDRNLAFGRQVAADCARLSGDVLPYITTANTARDMDAIRAALGEERISYLGYSHGTYLGTVYASLFPARTDRFVLDGAVDPALVWYGMRRSWSLAVAVRLPDFTAWAAARDDVYHFGATPDAVARTYAELAGRLDTAPVSAGGRTVDGNLFRETTRTGLYSDAGFPVLASFWTTVRAAPPAAAVASAAAPADNRRAMIYAIGCGDVAWPRDPAFYRAAVALDRRLFPATAGMPANVWPCAFWPFPPVEPPVPVVRDGPRDILILQNARDPGTPWTAALGLRAALGGRATLVTVDAGGQGVYLLGPSACANDAATAFLAGGTLPARDTWCPP